VSTELRAVAEASGDVAATSSRKAKSARIASLLAESDASDVPVIVTWLSGELPQRQIGVGWAALRTMPAPAEASTLTVASVHDRFSAIKDESGAGSQARRAALLTDLFTSASDVEQTFLRRLMGGELRQGALVGVMVDAIASASAVPADAVRRAAMLSGDLAVVASAALSGGRPALDEFGLQVGRPVGPMLAQTATSVADAIATIGGATIFEAKLDGARIQVHRDSASVRIFTRTLDDVTIRLPEVVEAVLAYPVSEFVADGEAIALRPDGRPQPFQVTASRFGRSSSLADARAEIPLHPYFFDLLHVDGEDLLDLPTADRLARLDAIVPAANRVARLVTADEAEAEAFLNRTLAAGHEGLLAKAPSAPYEAGRRGAGWLKVKPVHTLDLVVLAVEWGSGRRRGKLSNIHLGALDPATGEFVMLGKTFKGMTDAMLDWQTTRFTELADGPTDGWVVRLRPEQVVEIAFDGVQSSSRYPGKVALRFARVLRYRDDKLPTEIDTIDTVRSFAK